MRRFAGQLRAQVPPGGNPGANAWFLQSTYPYKCHLEKVASVGDWLKIDPQHDSRMVDAFLLELEPFPPRCLFLNGYCRV
jgi:hypothetical protein